MGGGQFFVILYGRVLWMAPNWKMEAFYCFAVRQGFEKEKGIESALLY